MGNNKNPLTLSAFYCCWNFKPVCSQSIQSIVVFLSQNTFLYLFYCVSKDRGDEENFATQTGEKVRGPAVSGLKKSK
jgi:hypothetical protein